MCIDRIQVGSENTVWIQEACLRQFSHSSNLEDILKNDPTCDSTEKKYVNVLI